MPQDERSGKKFFQHSASGATQWELPTIDWVLPVCALAKPAISAWPGLPQNALLRSRASCSVATPSATQPDESCRVELLGKSLTELKQKYKAAESPVSGSKAVLVERLMQDQGFHEKRLLLAAATMRRPRRGREKS